MEGHIQKGGDEQGVEIRAYYHEGPLERWVQLSGERMGIPTFRRKSSPYLALLGEIEK